MVIFAKSKLYNGTNKEMTIRQGYNQISKLFYILITDRKSKTTCRINMDEEFFHNFHNMGRFTYKQTKKDEGVFEDDV